MRNIGCRIIPSSLTNNLLIQLIHAATTSINYRLTSALTGTKSPQQLWFGSDHAHAKDIDFVFGDLALAKSPNQKNDVAPRADTVMVLYPNFNGLHSYQVYKLGTGTIVTRNHNTLQHIHWNPSDVAHIERQGLSDPDGVDLPRREPAHDSPAEPTPRSDARSIERVAPDVHDIQASPIQKITAC